MRFLLSIIFLILFLYVQGCSKKEDKPVTDDKKQTNRIEPPPNSDDTIENPEDSTMTPEEQFSTSIMSDFLDDSDDEDLQDYLETEIYKYAQNYNGVSVIELSPSTWFVSFEKDGNNKNFILQKYIDFKSTDAYFRMKETNLTVNDIVSKGRNKSSAGE
jgi:hypothetical protein